MDYHKWLDNYLQQYRKQVFKGETRQLLVQMSEMATDTYRRNAKLIFAGNGASAAIASHCAVDFTKQAGIRAIDFNEPDLITCFANDYGYEQWIAKAMEFYADFGDLVILISSSGKSPNIVKAAEYARQQHLTTITFTGFSSHNPLKQLGDLNFWVNSTVYNIVECTHMIWLTAAIDMIVAKTKYYGLPEEATQQRQPINAISPSPVHSKIRKPLRNSTTIIDGSRR